MLYHAKTVSFRDPNIKPLLLQKLDGRLAA